MVDEETLLEICKAFEKCAQICESFGQSNWSNRNRNKAAFDCAKLIRDSLIIERIRHQSKISDSFPYRQIITIVDDPFNKRRKMTMSL